MGNLCIDNGQITAVERTDEGAIRIWATVSRTGDLTYRAPNGEPYIERVTPDELFKADSLNTAWGKPITVGHPLTDDGEAIAVEPENMAQFRVGSTMQSMQQVSDRFLTLVAVIDDARGIEEIERGTREISAGYYRDPVVVDGVIHQVNRRYNHFAIVPRGRAGSDVRLHIDAETTIHPPQPPMKTITIDGVGYPVESPELATAIAALQKSHKSLEKQAEALKADAATSTAKATEAAAKLDQLQADHATALAELKATLDAACGERDALKAQQLTADAIAVAAQERVTVAEQVKLLNKDAVIDYSHTPEQMRRDAVAARGMSIDGKSDDYIAGVFSALVAAAPTEHRKAAIAKTAAAVPQIDAADSVDLAALRQRIDAEIANAYRGGQG